MNKNSRKAITRRIMAAIATTEPKDMVAKIRSILDEHFPSGPWGPMSKDVYDVTRTGGKQELLNLRESTDQNEERAKPKGH
jgi:hypothetical protein